MIPLPMKVVAASTMREERDAAGAHWGESTPERHWLVSVAEERPLCNDIQERSNLRKVMIVDDSVSIRRTIGFVLRRGGYEVIEAEDGCDALEKLARSMVDLVLTDINMPEMDGITLIRTLRQQPAMRSKPILMLTSETPGKKQEDEGRAAGASGWVMKPVDSEKLLQTLARILP